jgi:hypothetical protein
MASVAAQHKVIKINQCGELPLMQHRELQISQRELTERLKIIFSVHLLSQNGVEIIALIQPNENNVMMGIW